MASQGNMEMRTMSHYHKSYWTLQEDALLIQHVQQNGARRWDQVAKHITGRTGKSCRLRWFNELNPNINKTRFTDEEKQKLLRLHRVYGNKWSTMAKFFPGRTDNQLKNQYKVLMGCTNNNNVRDSVSPSSSNHRSRAETGVVGSSHSHDTSTETFCFTGLPMSVVQAISSHFYRNSQPMTCSNLNMQCSVAMTGGQNSMYPVCHITTHKNAVMSDANSATLPEFGREGKRRPHQFIDFLGVSTSK